MPQPTRPTIDGIFDAIDTLSQATALLGPRERAKRKAANQALEKQLANMGLYEEDVWPDDQ